MLPSKALRLNTYDFTCRRPVVDVPYTVNGKKMEVIVTALINGDTVKQTTSVANPGCLSEYETIGKDLRKIAHAAAVHC